LRWEHVDLDERTLRIPDTKNRQPLTLPLPDYLAQLLSARREFVDGPYVFPGTGEAGHLVEPRPQMRRVTKVSGVSFTLHDLRRTFITIAESLDIPVYAIKRLVNHSLDHDVTAGYVVMDIERLREPMQRIADFILGQAGYRDGAEVVELDKHRAEKA
jgi:integrase